MKWPANRRRGVGLGVERIDVAQSSLEPDQNAGGGLGIVLKCQGAGQAERMEQAGSHGGRALENRAPGDRQGARRCFNGLHGHRSPPIPNEPNQGNLATRE